MVLQNGVTKWCYKMVLQNGQTHFKNIAANIAAYRNKACLIMLGHYVLNANNCIYP